MRILFAVVFIALVASGCTEPTISSPDVAIIPNPLKVEGGSGVFTLDENASFGVSAELMAVTERFAYELRRSTGFPLPVEEGSGSISVTLDALLGAESYQLDVTKKDIKIVG